LAVGQLAGTSPFRSCTGGHEAIGLSSLSPVIDLFRARRLFGNLSAHSNNKLRNCKKPEFKENDADAHEEL
jgi:hypothetical protein